MRIVIDATAAVSGGKVYLDQILPRFARISADHEFVILHAGDFDRFESPASGSLFQFNRIDAPFLRTSGISSSISKMAWRSLQLSRELRRLKPDLFFSNAGFAPRDRVEGMKTVIALHNSMPLRDELIAEEKSLAVRLRLKALQRQIHRSLLRSDGAIVFSQDSKNRVVNSFPDLKLEPEMIHHGIDWGRSERETAKPALDQPYLLYVSQFHRYKNVLRLLEAFAVIAAKRERMSLVLAGDAADKRYWFEIEAKIRELAIGDRVRHIPARARGDLIGLYRGCLAFVHPSLAETCSLPLLEAMAMGKPVAAARESALPEMAGDAAIYFDPYDPIDIADKLESLIRDEKLRDELSRKAIERASHFSWDETAERTLNYFDRIRR